jgi:hypothetical protein
MRPYEFHGLSDSRTYGAWRNMFTRVYYNAQCSKYYKQKGITICDRWMTSFQNFYDDMGLVPDDLTLDRIDNDLGYFPENCRWASRETQQRNRSLFNVYVEYKGEKLLVCELAELVGLPQQLIRTRLKNGWSMEDAVSPMNRKTRENNRKTY